MASFGWKFCTVCLFYLLFVCLVCSEATIKDDPYYRYHTQVPPGHPVYSVIQSELADTPLGPIRPKRNVETATSFGHKISLIMNTNPPDTPNSIENTTNTKPATIRINEKINSQQSNDDSDYKNRMQMPSGHPGYDVIQSELADIPLDPIRLKRNVETDNGGKAVTNHSHTISLVPNPNPPNTANNSEKATPATIRINEKINSQHLNVNASTTEVPLASNDHIDMHHSDSSSTSASQSQVPNNKVPLPPNSHIVSAEFDSSKKSTTNILGTKSSSVLKDKDDEDILDEFSQELSNVTYTEHNITRIYKDSHTYYNSSFYVDSKIGQRFWVDMENSDDVIIHEMLSQSHRRAATVKLSFDFPFYGHTVRNVTIATGGFLFTGDHIHTWLAATQYIAPLMANFDTRMSEYSFVKYKDNGTAFTVLWENVKLKDSPEYGNFTFEVTLHKSGDIVFVYKNIPVIVENINDDHHPVKIGLSDAYVIDRTIFFVKRKTIYEYHRVNFNKEDIKNWTVIYLSALPTCLDLQDCDSCLRSNINLEISGDYADTRKCNWCPAVNRCSTGLDRLRQEWLANECDKMYASQCNESPPPPHAHQADQSDISVKHSAEHQGSSGVQLGVSGIISTLLLVTSLVAAGLLLLYAYRNPHSTPGQLLIRYRPSQWRWRRGEARYTAATIHM